MSRVIGISYCGAKNVEGLQFSIPFSNNIKVVSHSFILNKMSSPIYGDEVSLRFWKTLHIDIGAYSDATAYWQKTPGYKYIYTLDTKKFTVVDPNGNVEFERSNIDSMGDMGISFEIYKSHQFIIKFDTSKDKFPFYIPTKLEKEELSCCGTDSDVKGINNYISRGKKVLDYQYIKHMGSDSYVYNYVDTNKHYFNLYYEDKLHTLGLYPKSVFVNIYDNSYLLSSYDISVADNTGMPFMPGEFPCDPTSPGGDPSGTGGSSGTGCPAIPSCDPSKTLQGTPLFWSMLLPKYSKSLYPMLMPILKDGEVINNRPVYEIWMIWGFYKYLTSSYTTNESNDHEVLSFDLSPNWS